MRQKMPSKRHLAPLSCNKNTIVSSPSSDCHPWVLSMGVGAHLFRNAMHGGMNLHSSFPTTDHGSKLISGSNWICDSTLEATGKQKVAQYKCDKSIHDLTYLIFLVLVIFHTYYLSSDGSPMSTCTLIDDTCFQPTESLNRSTTLPLRAMCLKT